MLISKEVEVRWNGFTRKWYEDRGYKWTKANDYFICKIEDVMPTSTVKVIVRCDYCGREFEKEHRQYFKEREIVNKTCCSNRKCMVTKSEEVNLIKYGVTNFRQTDEGKKLASDRFKTPFNEVVKYCADKGLDLLSSESDYMNDRSRLRVICRNHSENGIQDTCFANIKKNKHCCVFGGTESTADHRRLDGELVYKEFIDAGLIPQFKPDDYQNNLTPLPYICPKHQEKGIQYREYGNLAYNEGCYFCAKERVGSLLRMNEDDVFDELRKSGLYPIEGEKYKNKEIHIKYRCINHPQYIQSTTYSSFRMSKQCCEFCRKEENVSTLNRRLRSSIDRWRKESEIQCGFKCIITGSNLYQIHHLKGFNEITKEALDILEIEIKLEYSGDEIIMIRDKVVELHDKYPLGVCLDERLHIFYHQKYGNESTPKHFEEFRTRLIQGEFNDFLKENNLTLAI